MHCRNFSLRWAETLRLRWNWLHPIFRFLCVQSTEIGGVSRSFVPVLIIAPSPANCSNFCQCRIWCWWGCVGKNLAVLLGSPIGEVSGASRAKTSDKKTKQGTSSISLTKFARGVCVCVCVRVRTCVCVYEHACLQWADKHRFVCPDPHSVFLARWQREVNCVFQR